MRHADLGCAAGGNVTNGGSAVTAWPVAMTAGASPALVWNLPATSGIDAAVPSC